MIGRHQFRIGHEGGEQILDYVFGVPVFRRMYEEARRLYPAAREKMLFNEALKRMIDRLVGDLIESTARRVREAGVQSLAEVRGWPQRLAGFSEEVNRERQGAKDFLYKHVYYSEALQPEKTQAEVVTKEVFEYFVAHPQELPRSYREQSEREPPHRVVCDYVAGMTDPFILAQHERLCAAVKQNR